MTLAPAERFQKLTLLVTRVLWHVFGAESWAGWRALLTALEQGLDALDARGRALVEQITGRTRLPGTLKELWIFVGRRAGKSMISALLAVWAVTCRTYTLAPGEVGVFMVIAADRRQARVVKRYISGLLRASDTLAAEIAEETADSITLRSGLVVEIHTSSFRSLRGYTCVGAVCDEVCFWTNDEDSANPDREVLVALRAAMATVPEALLVAMSSPYARRGEAWRVYERHFGQDESDRVLVVQAATRTLNPTVDPALIAAAYDDDPSAAAAEFGAEWRRDVETFLPREALAAVVVPHRADLPPMQRVPYVAFVDPAGGSGADSFTLAIAHLETRDRAAWAVVDAVLEVRPPFSPETTVGIFAARLREYGIGTVVGDRYAGEWPREQFSKHGIAYAASPRAKADIYRDFLPVVMSGRVELPDHARLVAQLHRLERRTGPSGRDYVDHPPRGNDDVANAVAGAVVSLAAHARYGGGTLKLRGSF